MSIDLIAGLAAVAAMLLCVLLHVGALELILRKLCRRSQTVWSLLIGVPLLFLCHAVQVSIFAAVLWTLHIVYGPQIGELSSGFHTDWVNAWYFSASVFTTVGFGDITPTGPLRIFVGLEAIAGLVLITWSASFTFFGMQRSWERRLRDEEAVRQAAEGLG